MKCISEEKLQHYIDGELSESELLFVKSHLADCSRCYERMQELEQRASLVKTAFASISDERVIVPEFKKSCEVRKEKKQLKAWGLDLAVASVVLCLLGVFFAHEQKRENEFMLQYGYDMEFDANLPPGEQEITITYLKEES
jgi:anti-sigma factor RsiW